MKTASSTWLRAERMPVFLLVLCFVIPASVALILGSPACCGDTSCRNRCDDTGWDAKDDTKRHCHCDPFCSLHQDCCPDYYEYCGKHNKTANQLKTELFRRRAECVKTNAQINHPGTLMITTCASDWKDTKESSEQEKCLASTNANSTYTSSNITEDIPVFQLGFEHATYRNAHCAACNRVPPFIIFFWDLQIECEIRPSDHLSDQQKLDFMLQYCSKRSMQPDKNFNVRYCFPQLNPTSECSTDENTTFRQSCLQDPIAIVHDKNTNRNYRNYGCFRCNGLSEQPGCGPAPSAPFFNPKSFEVVMDFKNKKATTAETCDKGQVYDPRLEICREGKIPSLSAAMRDKYQVNAWLSPHSDGKRLTEKQFQGALSEHLSLDAQQISDITRTNEGRYTAFLFNLDADRTQKQLDNRSAAEISSLIRFNSSFTLSAANRSWTVFKVTSRQLACSKGDLYGPDEMNISLPDLQVFIYNTSESLSNEEYHLIRINDSTPLEQASVFVCRSSFTASLCSKLLLSIEKEEYTILPNKSLLYNITGEAIPLGTYELDKTKAWICSDHLTDSRNNSTTTATTVKRSVLLRYTTIVGMSISVFCLFLVLLTHCILPELRNPLPGKNLMSLCASLFLAHFLWLFGSGDTDKKTFCAVTAMVLHYFFLVSFSCTVILAFDTWRTFSAKMSAMKGASSRGGCGTRFLVYTGLAWGIPLMLVATSVVLDYFDVVEVGYGNSSVCWITNTEALIVSFAAPVACALIFNITAFSQTVWAINRAKQRAAKLNTSRQNSTALKIYARLMTLMGFGWLFGFSAELIHKSLMYPFVILNTSQGVYIFLAFVCKARVLKMLKQKLRPSTKTDRKAAQQTTTSAAFETTM